MPKVANKLVLLAKEDTSVGFHDKKSRNQRLSKVAQLGQKSTNLVALIKIARIGQSGRTELAQVQP